MTNYLILYEDVLVPFRNGLGDFVASDGDAHLAELVHETAERVTSFFCFLFVFGIYLDGDWKYFHLAVILIGVAAMA